MQNEPAAPHPLRGTPSLLRAINDRTALELLLEHGPMSRADIGALTGLSKPTTSHLLLRLKEAGLVVLEGRRAARGPAAELYAVNPRSAYVAGMDVTPERIMAAVADVTGRVLAEFELPTPGRGGGNAAVRTRRALRGATAAAGLAISDLRHVVLGTPGALDPKTGELVYAPQLVRWEGPGLLGRIQDALGVPVDIENDVTVVAMAEYDHGAAHGSPSFALLWVSDGIGMAHVRGGVPHRGATGGAGEVGYMPVPGQPVFRDVRRMNTGGFQCLAGGPVVRKILRDAGFPARNAAVAVARAVTALPRPGERADRAGAALDEVAVRVATGLAIITSVLDPELIVLAGDVLQAGGEPLRSRIDTELHAIAISRPRVRVGSVEGNPVLLGALHLALSAARRAVFGPTVA